MEERRRPRYMISVAAELVGMHPQTLRIYEQKGLVHPQRTAGNTRLYSDADVERVQLIQRLTTDLGLNLAGVERVLHMEDELAAHAAPPRTDGGRDAAGSRRGPPVLSPRPRPLPARATARAEELRHMDFTKLTIKSQEAVAEAQELARRRGNPEVTPEHLLVALLDQELFADWQGLRPEAERKLDALPAVQGGRQQPNASAGVLARARRGRRGAPPARGRLRLDRPRLPGARRRLRATRSSRGSSMCAAAARHVAGPGGQLPGAREVRPRPHRGRRGREARPGDRPRRGDPPRHPGPVAAHEEQPGADRRARRRQDRDRRGARAAHRRRRRARGAEGQARLVARHRRAARRLEVPRRVRGAPEGGARGDQGEPRARIDPVHRRAAHDRRRRAPPRARSTPPTCSSRCSRAASCAASARRRSTSTASTSRRTPRSSAASSRCSSASRASPTRSRSCAA